MNIKPKTVFFISTLLLLGLTSCNSSSEGDEAALETETAQKEAEEPLKEAMITQQQFDALAMEIDTLRQRNMTGFVEANGQLEVPPQNEANVTSVIGANVAKIMVIEGDQVKKGQTLAHISHPDIVKLQTQFLNASNQLNLQEKEFNRQQKLYDAGVGSGESFQRAEAEYQSAKGMVNGLKAQLELLNLNPASIIKGNIHQRISVTSPISGAVQKVNVKTGQYVQPQTNMFEIVNTEHVHADLMVFEDDVHKIEVGQEVNFTVGSQPGMELYAEIISIGKTFEQDPKALHVHAEIVDKPENLIPGMYVRGRINVENTKTIAFPENAVAKDGDIFYVFKAEREGEAWSFKPVEVRVGASSNGWSAVEFLTETELNDKFAYNNAYYLMAEMKKGDGGHHH